MGIKKGEVKDISTKQKFDLGGINWTVIKTSGDLVECITSEPITRCAFNDRSDDVMTSSLLSHLAYDVFYEMVEAGAPEEMIEGLNIVLKSKDGLDDEKVHAVCVLRRSILVAYLGNRGQNDKKYN